MSATHGLQGTAAHAGPNMTPMVDIVMCILIFFMLGSTFAMPDLFLPSNTPIGKGLDTERHRLLSGTPPPMQQKLEMRVIGNDTKLVAFGQMYDVNPAAMGNLAEMLSSKRKQFSGEVQFIIMPDTVIPYQDVITVYDACIKARLESVAFANPRR